MRNDKMTAPKPTAIVTTAMVLMIEEKEPGCSRLILLAMKYGRFKTFGVILALPNCKIAKMIRIIVSCLFLLVGLVGLQAQPRVILGIEQLDEVLTRTKGKRVAVYANNTSVLGYAHLVDLMRSLKIDIKKIFAPEHGFRGNVEDGGTVADGVDTNSGLPVVSLYGKSSKPTPEQLADIDIVVFDIQDVGTRFYTYTSSLTYLMEACAENNKAVLLLDRPNPNSGIIDGPVMKDEFRSFVGMHPIPIAYGMTIGELALMINGEGWLAGGKKCQLEVLPLKNWKHGDPYSLRVKPSPNLPNDHAIALYPYICLFEGTAMSLGRGTQMPFEILGHPDLKDQPFSFTPVSIEGMSKTPPLQDKLCHGIDLRNEVPEKKISLKHLIEFYQLFPNKEKFFIPYFDKLAGNAELKEQIKQGLTEDQIRATWQQDLDAFKAKRKKYLLYP